MTHIENNASFGWQKSPILPTSTKLQILVMQSTQRKTKTATSLAREQDYKFCLLKKILILLNLALKQEHVARMNVHFTTTQRKKFVKKKQNVPLRLIVSWFYIFKYYNAIH